MPNTFVPNAKIQTWGTSGGVTDGFRKALIANLHGENVGHSSIQIEIPVNDVNTRLTATYCKSALIPCERLTIKDENGTNIEVYRIRFSFLPGRTEDDLFRLSESYQQDCMFERAGHHTTERDYSNTEELSERKASTRDIKIFPACSLTDKGRAMDFTTPEGQYILNKKTITNKEDLLQTINVLKEKTEQLKHAHERIINLKLPKYRAILLILKTLGLEPPPSGLINCDDIDKVIDTSKKKSEIEKEIEGLKIQKTELFDKVTKKKECESILYTLMQLKKILKLLSSITATSNLDELSNLAISPLPDNLIQSINERINNIKSIDTEKQREVEIEKLQQY